jgi:hypothetical protein
LTQSDIVSNLKNNYGEAMVYRDADHMGTAWPKPDVFRLKEKGSGPMFINNYRSALVNGKYYGNNCYKLAQNEGTEYIGIYIYQVKLSLY